MIGVYGIYCNINHKIYIGSSVCIRVRWNGHKAKLKRNAHENPYLQHAWNKYGEHNFNFHIIKETDIDNLLSTEQGEINKYKNDELFNINLDAKRPPRKSGLFNMDGSISSLFPIPGNKYGQLEVTDKSFVRKGSNGHIYVECECKCGVIRDYRAFELTKGSPVNCGCDKSHMYGQKHLATTNGKTSKEFKIWSHIKSWCYNQNDKEWIKYGGKGIKMQNDWRSDFQVFLKDIGYCPGTDYIFARKDTNKNFDITNCIWMTRKQMCHNRKNTLYLTYNNETKPLRAWAELLDVDPRSLWNRKKLGWSDEDIISVPVKIGNNQNVKKTRNIKKII